MKNIYIVEGTHDVIKLHEVKPNAYYIITNGSETSDITISEIKRLAIDNRIILLLDPDGPGEKIRRKINDQVPNAINVYVNKKDAISHNKRKVGIEHMDKKILAAALEEFKDPVYSTDVNIKALYSLELVGKPNSKSKRLELCNELNIGYCNAKTLIYKCNLFGIMIEDLIKTLGEING